MPVYCTIFPNEHWLVLSGPSFNCLLACLVWCALFCMLCMHQALAVSISWWRHPMETFSMLLALCEGNPPVISGFPSQRPVTWSFDVFFDLCLNKRESKQLRHQWFETPSRSWWRAHYEVTLICRDYAWSIKLQPRNEKIHLGNKDIWIDIEQTSIQHKSVRFSVINVDLSVFDIWDRFHKGLMSS